MATKSNVWGGFVGAAAEEDGQVLAAAFELAVVP